MISRCPLCRAFVGTVHAPTHAPRLARHPSVSLEQLGATPPATWPSDDDLPPELRS